jgi:tetratricopeptide (TPR) repeat protein
VDFLAEFASSDRRSQVSRLGASPDRLDSWKEIASYLKREVRTVQLWEKREGMPVHRHFHTQLGTVFAFRSEIEEWSRQATRRLSSKEREVAKTATENATPLAIGPVEIEIADLTGIAPSRELRSLMEDVLAGLQRLDQVKVTITRPQGAAEANTDSKARLSDSSCTKYTLRWTFAEESTSTKGRSRFGVDLVAGLCGSPVWVRKFPDPSPGGADGATLVEQIVQCVWLKVVSFCRSAGHVPRAENTSDREAYLRGRYFQSQRNESGLRKSVGWFRTAIEMNSESALAYSGLADSLTLLSFYEIVPPLEVIPEARRAALRAIELDGNLAEARASLADIHFHFDRNWTSAEQQYRRAIECNPSYALGYHWYANLLTARGQHEAAQTAIMHAAQIDPVSVITQVWAGVTSHMANRFDEAIRHYRSALELDPRFICAHMYLAQTLEQKGSFAEALTGFDVAMALAGGSSCIAAMKAHTHAIAGDHESAQKILRELSCSSDLRCMPSYDIAATYVALGDFSQSIEWLRRACLEHNMRLFSLSHDPRFDKLRDRTAFSEIVERVGTVS